MQKGYYLNTVKSSLSSIIHTPKLFTNIKPIILISLKTQIHLFFSPYGQLNYQCKGIVHINRQSDLSLTPLYLNVAALEIWENPIKGHL
jgi:hypothetical protein